MASSNPDSKTSSNSISAMSFILLSAAELWYSNWEKSKEIS
jgi:hypothetical protein